MSAAIFRERIEKLLRALSPKTNSLVVLKGIPLEAMDAVPPETIRYEAITQNPLGYLMTLVNSERKYISYEEFLLIADLALAQYAEIIILNNNIYMSQYPVSLFCTDETKQGLLTHFLDIDDADDEAAIETDTSISSLFIGLKEFNGYLIGVYNDEKYLDSEKIINVNLFEPRTEPLIKKECSFGYIDLIEESDYIKMIKQLFEEPDELFVRTTNYIGDKKRLLAHLQMLAYYWADWTDIILVQAENVSPDYLRRPEYREILEQYWGHSTFRNIKVYNMAKLEDGEKEKKVRKRSRVTFVLKLTVVPVLMGDIIMVQLRGGVKGETYPVTVQKVHE